MLINLNYPAVPKGVSVTIDGSTDDDDHTLSRIDAIVKGLHKHHGGLLGILRRAISPDVIQSITDKATDAAIAGIASEAKKV